MYRNGIEMEMPPEAGQKTEEDDWLETRDLVK